MSKGKAKGSESGNAHEQSTFFQECVLSCSLSDCHLFLQLEFL